ncbi:2TM domain-containing protein [Neolewinella aurantiaca]|uniref:2TM domain-containing protein n=1 Tax=Neolewinella aurantiaca TaxID=2602767 RepID=A0A5C7FXB7_9BACT|nr:2TM domain-containing protein [Neolewinella aurantiaca]TXF91408.1 2TM domain-containing protein [Neolewinella aurantiaca]
MARNRKTKYEEKTLREKKTDFRRHFRTYLVMSVFFVCLNFFGGSNHFWAIWPILGWGIGVAMQGLSLYGPLADPEDTHPDGRDASHEFSGPLPDITDEDVRRRKEELELRELETRRPYRDEDLV